MKKKKKKRRRRKRGREEEKGKERNGYTKVRSEKPRLVQRRKPTTK